MTGLLLSAGSLFLAGAHFFRGTSASLTPTPAIERLASVSKNSSLPHRSFTGDFSVARIKILTGHLRASTSPDERIRVLAELHPLLFDSTSAREIDWLASDQVDADVFTATWQQWANQSPEAALSWLQRHPNCERFSHVRDAAVAGWAQADGESALTWAQREPEVIARGHLLACVAVGYAKADPEFAATVVNRLVTSGTSRQHAVEGIAVAWAQSDPASAATWALGITEATAATGPLDLVLYSWFGDDRAAVEKWVRALPEKDKRDAAWSKLVRLQIEKDPAPAAIIAAEIGDSSIRARETANVVRHWAQQDFDLAGEWTLRLPSSPLRTQLVADLAAIAQERPAIP